MSEIRYELTITGEAEVIHGEPVEAPADDEAKED